MSDLAVVEKHPVLQKFCFEIILTIMMGCWHDYVSGSRCRFAYGHPADATVTHYLLLQL